MSSTAVTERWPLVGRRPELSRFSHVLGESGSDAFLIHGPPGTGKTRLAEECLRAAERMGRACGRGATGPEASMVPLGALAHLLSVALDSAEIGSGEPVDPVKVFARAQQAFEARGGGERFVLLVDGLHELDGCSAMLLRQLLVAGTVFLIGTVPDNLRVPTSGSALWLDDRCHRVDLDHLPRDGVETLLFHALGAPVDGPTAHTLWSTSRGNVLFLRELVLGALQSGVLVDDGGVWRLTQALPSTPRLNELVTSVIAGVGESGRRALDLLALCGPFGLGPADDSGIARVFESLEELGLVTVTADGRRRQVQLAHPVYGHALRDLMPELRRRGLVLDRARAVESWGARRHEDVLRVATWRLEEAGEADVDMLVRAARIAYEDREYALVVKLAEGAQAWQVVPEAGVQLGKALHELGSFAQAEAQLTAASRLTEGNEQHFSVAAVRSANLLKGLLRPAEALAVCRAAHAAATDESDRVELIAQEAWTLVHSGQPVEARAVLEALPRVDATRVVAVRALAESYVMSFAGFPDVALDIARAGHAEHLRLGDDLWLDSPAGHVIAQVLALGEAGRLAEAAELAAVGYREASAQQAPFLQIRFAYHCGRVSLLQGAPRTAKRWFTEAVARSEATGFAGARALALSGLANAVSLLGDADAAGAAIRAMDEAASTGFLRQERELGRAWWLVASGDPAGACRVLSEAAADAIDSGHLSSAGWLLHDVARLGQPKSVAAPLEELAQACDSELLRARAAHAGALATVDADALGHAVDRFEVMGAFLVAAEAAGAAAQAMARAGLGRRSTAFATRAAGLAGRCEGARTPAMLGSDAAADLTPRERGDRRDGRGRGVQLGHRHPTVPFGPDRGQPPAPRLREIGRHGPPGSPGGSRSPPERWSAVTPEQVALIQSSFAELGPHTSDLSVRFYEHLFEAEPSARTMFSTDPELQEALFAEELSEIVNSISRFDAFVPRTRDLGVRHAAYGVTYEHSETSGRVLQMALADTLGPMFTDECDEAWSLAFRLMAETMMQGAADAAS